MGSKGEDWMLDMPVPAREMRRGQAILHALPKGQSEMHWLFRFQKPGFERPASPAEYCASKSIPRGVEA
ncbi:hypothetical protein LMH87_000056 [Akanthomyces muscarius]|uniref:Uncharacterized protein n=1 Tax=Akanthomyces muscarius TaxID=2231603 RepID=A0A9W8QGJ9_AKAMU|nr:hypothetical protein LMH87_000056 [Akanthomyces muscarius]KAJ4154778.1 hypothetical protein LMH87_000056 [Akanthomyces muscarius]